MEISRPDRSEYRKEIQEGVRIFEKGFKAIQEKSTFPAQKREYETSMGEALQAIQDAAKGLANKELLQMKEQLDKDYQSYLADPTTENESKIEHDLDNLKNS